MSENDNPLDHGLQAQKYLTHNSSCYALCFVNKVMRCYNRYSFSICDLFPLINLCLVITRLTRDVDIHSLRSWWTGEIWDSMLSLLLKMVFQLWRQVEGVTSLWGQCTGGLINFKIMGRFKGAILQGACVVRQEKRTNLFRVHEENPFRSVNQIKAAANFPGTSWMVMNRLRDINVHCWRAASNEGLTEGQDVDCIAFTSGSRDFDWGSVIFIDETSISSICESCEHVYHEPGTRYDTCNIQWHERSRWFSISCWGWMSHAGIGILENVMLPSVRVWNPEGNLIFQQDNLPVHCSMGVQRWFARRPEIKLIPWSPKSPECYRAYVS